MVHTMRLIVKTCIKDGLETDVDPTSSGRAAASTGEGEGARHGGGGRHRLGNERRAQEPRGTAGEEARLSFTSPCVTVRGVCVFR
jgi:hypothetical protein